MQPQEEPNQKLSLIAALLSQGAWSQAKEMMDRLPQYHATSYLPVAQLMCRLIHHVIEPLYRR